MKDRTAQAMAWLGKPGALAPCFRLHALLPAVLCIALVWPFGGGWTTVQMMAGTVTPGAQGTIKFKIGDNGNTELDVKASALATPSSLTPPENAYVLWTQPPGQAPQNQGGLKVNKNEQAELKTEVANKRFRIFITAEQNQQAQTPMGPTVLSAEVSQH